MLEIMNNGERGRTKNIERRMLNIGWEKLMAPRAASDGVLNAKVAEVD